ncbi:hypothetical protein GLP59_17195 [Sulfitobacter sp. M220]|uniref:hypothetical protein n=1 Tax=Sulfitobacter sp. M220 TaxID=2675333 RepID=UPI001F3426ED|nr:hypothetical protein [Sulfitobacter sp. M220]MCF7779345.1 hypothetical protein [Sulfitobacter sp. M220]
MHTPFKLVARHVNANPAIYVGHALWSRAVPSSEQMRVSNLLLGVRDPLFAFGSDVLDYYRAPQGAQVCRSMASGDRLIKSIEATTAQFATLNTRSFNDPRYFWTRHAISQGTNLKTPEQAQMSKRLALLDMPGARLIIMSLLMAADKSSKKLIGLMSFDQPYALFKSFRRAHRVFEWVFPALANTGVDLTRFFDDMSKLKPAQKFPVKHASARPVPALKLAS